jgi:hypothetical protein
VGGRVRQMNNLGIHTHQRVGGTCYNLKLL